MNKWIKRMVVTLLVVTQFISMPGISAEAKAESQTEKEKIENEVKGTQKEIDKNLSEASEITISLEELSEEIKEQEELIVETEEEIKEQETLVEDRYQHTAEQLKLMQKGEVNKNIVIRLFQSESFSDFVNRLYTVSVLTKANEELLSEAHTEYEKLDTMKEELLVDRKKLDKKQKETSEKKANLDEKLSKLKSTLAENQEKLDEINAKEAKEKERKANVTSSNKSSTPNSSSKKDTSTTTKSSSTKNSSSTADAGNWMNFQSTGYSTQEAGLSTRTATGIDLTVNPQVIAVDPSQIPLGSLVEIKGQGVYVAGDTGGAINGKIVDVHFSTVAQAMNWGRRNVQLRILN